MTSTFRLAIQSLTPAAAVHAPGVQDLSHAFRGMHSQFAGTPYWWGGRSLFGLDCSGFTTVVFQLCRISCAGMPWHSVSTALLVSFLPSPRAGALAFFPPADGPHFPPLAFFSVAATPPSCLRPQCVLPRSAPFGISPAAHHRSPPHFRLLPRLLCALLPSLPLSVMLPLLSVEPNS